MRTDPTDEETHTDATPLGLPTEVRAFQGRRAGIVSRSLAGSVDLVVVALVLIGVYLGLAGLLVLWDPREAHLPDVSRPTVLLLAATLTVSYLAASWTTTGRTAGDQLLGLRVVDSRGRRLHLARSTVRALLCVAFPLGMLWAAVSRSSRSVADLALGTVVIYDWAIRRTDRD